MNMAQTTNDTPLAELVKAAQQGQQAAFDRMMDQTHLLVRKVANPLVPADVVDDMVQETYITVLQKLHHLKTPEAFRGWLSRIALTTCYQWRRKRKPTEEFREHHEDIAPNQGPDLKSALEALKQTDRDILILREYIGLTYEELADALNLTEGTVRSRLFYARKKLRVLLN
jgi:RNA polymerase sigma-70 factor (ECF subfamily)